MPTKTRKSPPRRPFSEPQERFPLANRPAPLAKQQAPWRAGYPPEQDYPELPPFDLSPGDIIRAAYYTGGLHVPGNAIHLAGGWGIDKGCVYVFEILRIEPTRSRWGGCTAACNYYLPGEEPKAGVFLLAGASYEVLERAVELDEEDYRTAAAVIAAVLRRKMSKPMTAPKALPASTDGVIVGEYEEP